MIKSDFHVICRVKEASGKYITTWRTVNGFCFKWYDEKHSYTFYFGVYNESGRKYTIVDLKSGKAFIIAGNGKNKTIDDCINRLYNEKCDIKFIINEIESSFDEQSEDSDYYQFNNIDIIERLKNLKYYTYKES